METQPENQMENHRQLAEVSSRARERAGGKSSEREVAER